MPEKTIRKRQVFYISGYDPMGSRRYRELYRNEAKKQSEISGYDINIIARKKNKQTYGWNIESEIDGIKTYTAYDLLIWSDVVRSSQKQSILFTFILLIKTAWIYISSGALYRLAQMRKQPVLVALYPIFILTLQLYFALIMGFLAYWGVSFYIFPPLTWGIGFLVLWIVLRFFKLWDHRIFAYYLMHDYAFSAGNYGKNSLLLDKKIVQFRDIIINSLNTDIDEVLIVGHSSGAHIAINTLASLLRELKEYNNKTYPALSLLTLGHVIPMISFLPKANQLRADLNMISHDPRITWVDITAPTDVCSFSLCDPVAVSGVDPDKSKKHWPLILSAAYKRTISEERMKDIKLDFFKIHILYLCHLNFPEQYDYFCVTAGPKTLSTRFKDYKSSPQTFNKPMSPYSSME